ncbi:hypothetical protein ACFY7H_22540 [Streptomyces sp. NPDC012794]|uniref:hypothetical protein n=1 Tax=Streptomyces sp. NPDC012794 TaxID=3364850 RepID=UPI0036A4E4A9
MTEASSVPPAASAGSAARPSPYERHGVDGIAFRAAPLPDQGRADPLRSLDAHGDAR